MVRTHGLTHINLAVLDPERSLRFYERAFGITEYYGDAESVQVQGPGEFDVIAFERTSSIAGSAGGITHFGFRLIAAGDIEVAVREIEGAGGKILEGGEFGPGLPYLYCQDPDGYQIAIGHWGRTEHEEWLKRIGGKA